MTARSPNAGRLLRLLRQRRRSARRSPKSLVQHLKRLASTEQGRRAADQRLADRRRRRPDQEGRPRGAGGSGYKTLAEFDTPDWAPPKAQQWASGQITRFGAEILGVVAANDGTGGGAIAAFKAAGVDPVPPVTGNDATHRGAAADHRRRPVQHHLQAQRDRRRGGGRGGGEVPRRRDAGGRRRRSTTRPSELFIARRGHPRQHQGRDLDKQHRQGPDVCTGRYADGCKELGIQ